jgi:hypothetical protein
VGADGYTQIDALYECCNLFYQKNGDDASTVSCPKANLLRYVRSHVRGKGMALTRLLDYQPQDASTSPRAVADWPSAVMRDRKLHTETKRLACTVQKCFSRPIQSRSEYIEGQNQSKATGARKEASRTCTNTEKSHRDSIGGLVKTL